MLPFQNFEENRYVNLRLKNQDMVINYRGDKIINLSRTMSNLKHLSGFVEKLDISLDIYKEENQIYLHATDEYESLVTICIEDIDLDLEIIDRRIDGIFSKIISDCGNIIVFTFNTKLDCYISYNYKNEKYEVWLKNQFMINPFNTRYINNSITNNYPILVIDANKINELKLVEEINGKYVSKLEKIFSEGIYHFGFIVTNSEYITNYYFAARGNIYTDFQHAIYDIMNIKYIFDISLDEFKNLLTLIMEL
jgi:hypothetical protein